MRFGSFASIGFIVALGAIIVMYLLKRKYVDTVVPSHMLWNRVLRNLEANKPWQKLRNQMLFWIQMLIAALLVLALMEPVIPYEKEVKSHLVLVVDTSASMSATDMQNNRGDSNARIDQMKSKLREFVNGPASKSEITLIRIADQPELLESRQTDKNLVLQSIDQLTVNYGVSAYRETMSLASSLTRLEKDAEIVVYTDEQWPEQSAGITYNVPVRVESIVGTGDNIAIAQFGVKLPASGAADKVQGVAVIRNWSSITRTMDAVLTIGEEAQVGEVHTLTLEPGKQQTLQFTNLPVASYYGLQLDVEDSIQADNRAYAFLSDQGQARVLLVTEGNLFLEKALQLSGAQVVKIQIPSDGNSENFADMPKDTIIVPDTKLDMVILDHVADPYIESTEWKELIAQHPVWRIGSTTAKQIAPITSTFEIDEHPINRYIRMADTHIAQLDDIQSVSWGQPIIKLGENPVIFAGTEQGQPRLTFNFDLHQSDLPLRSEFPILVRNSIDWLSESRMTTLGRLTAGSTKEIPLSPRAARVEWKQLTSNIDASKQTVSASSEQSQTSGVTAYQTVPAIPGLYQLEQYDAAGVRISYALAEVAMDAAESNVLQQEKLSFQIKNMNQAEGIAADQMLADDSNTPSGMQLTTWLALFIMALLLLEWGVYQRGNSI
ncbi:VWA domain-containing protein [Paenibacillus albiflavus]|uniref:VWA domain-containing protein n=1 Tax=Paenibacillus albiflavus TaxID=2545760 RepID=A0A4V2WN02_9BACL|nr:BatA and WFA domain-containing protein [Paenibacillus albiflavus]TCZ73562.1 VWA domain-containing protein [Paenibacillus albiflavus]